MGKLNRDQALQLANDFLAFAQAIGEYRYRNFKELSKPNNQRLKDLHWSILNYSDDLFTLAGNLAIDDVEESLTKINEITADIKSTYEGLQDVKKVINVATAIVTLGAAIITSNPVAIEDSLGKLIETWQA